MDIRKYWNIVLKQDEKIMAIDEYWAEDGAPPKWRQEMQIGQKLDGFF